MKKAMGLWQAIIIILLISGMMLIVLKYASISAKHTRNSFVREQAELFLNSAIEQTLLKISLHPRTNNNCLDNVSISLEPKRGITYSANVDIKKYYLQSTSNDYNLCNGTIGITTVPIGDTGDSHGMVLLEVEVNATKTDGTVVSRILRRTLQQP
ncbi:MAG: hypothetical protein U9N02_01290 [Campylobacterota bacterium]|nr:hypothetical protein [Campylobacterota bacterium]